MKENWVTAWSTSTVKGGLHLGPLHLNNGLFHSTARTVLRPCLDGERIRLLFTNRYGKKPLTLNKVSVAHIKKSSKLDTDTPVKVTFGGKESVTIPVGEEILSDEISFSVRTLEKIAVNIYVEKAFMRTKGLYGGETYLSAGDCTEKEGFLPMWKMNIKTTPATFQVVPFLTRLDVLAKEDAYALAIVGDSTVFNEVPYMITKKLRDRGIDNISVIQQALAGNRLLDDGRGIIGNFYGEKLVDRYDKDVAKCCGVKKMVIKEGVNDIIHPRSASCTKKSIKSTAREIIGGLNTVIAKAERDGIEVYLSPFTPFKGFGKILFFDDFKWSREVEELLDEVNAWIKTWKNGYVNIDAFYDKNDPYVLRKDITADHIHYGEKGQELFADSVMKLLFKD